MSEVNFVCPTCGSSDFITKSSFDRHIKIDSVLSVVVENQYKYKSTLKKLNIIIHFHCPNFVNYELKSLDCIIH